MNNDLISREYITGKICGLYSDGEKANNKDKVINEVMNIIDNATAVDLDDFYGKAFRNGEENALKIRELNERPQGKWITIDAFVAKCSVCGVESFATPFCPCCGADMRKGGAE